MEDNTTIEETTTNTYTNHNGEKIEVSKLQSTHLFNALAKKIDSVFKAKNKEEAYEIMKEVRALKEETFKRVNIFIENLGDDEDGE